MKPIILKIENNQLHLNFNNLDKFIPVEEFPLRLYITKYINGEVVWTTDVYDNWFVDYYDFANKNLVITTKSGTLIFDYLHKPNELNDLNQIFYLWCKANHSLKGLAIGTHDGEYGEWVQPIKENLTGAVLVEASETQFNTLKGNFKNIKNVTLINALITSDGGDVKFYESEVGYFNSTKKYHLEKYNIKDIKEVNKESISLKNLILKNFRTKPDWLHLDVEGLDAELLLSLKDDVNLLPNLIIYEFINLTEKDRNDVITFLKYNNYELFDYEISTLAIKTL